jgi:SAM-dependent methyltransferase
VTEARAVYDALAERYVEWAGTQLSAAIDGLLDRTLLDDFLELASTVPGGRPVADLGCGPGRVAAYVVAHGFDAVGLDVSSAMLAEASDAHPEVGFAAAALADLPVRDAGLAGAVCWYSIIHTPPERLDEICVELARVLVPEAPLLVAFQSGDDEGVRRDDAFGTGRALTSHRHRSDAVSHCLPPPASGSPPRLSATPSCPMSRRPRPSSSPGRRRQGQGGGRPRSGDVVGLQLGEDGRYGDDGVLLPELGEQVPEPFAVIRVVNAATGELLRHLDLDPTRDYQPTGRPPGPPPKRPTS